MAVMRLMMLLFAGLFVSTAAAGSEPYANERFGYSISIPDGFAGQGESENGDGQTFVIEGKPIDLLVWGGNLMEPDFESEVAAAMGYTEEAGWNLTYQASTPRWASFSGTQGGRILYQRLILLCDGTSYASFRLEYSVRDRAEMDPAVEQMVASLKAGAC
ncbi:MAG: hypothetical protein KKF33_00235 [Alphaproteobacteria bacterium]|nr:hypothetical protein [Alphaproteobacteria bacterium]